MSDRLRNSVAIVTGGWRGIGRGIVECLAQSGASVVFTDIDMSGGAACEAELRDRGHNVLFVAADTTSEADVDKVVAIARKEFGRIDILCPNAAIYPETSLADTSAEEWDQVCAVNLKGPFLFAKACLKTMQEQQHGRIIMTSSITGPLVSSSGHGHYGATKAGILGFMRTAALEWAPWNITINAVLPGNILTEGIQLHRSAEFIAAQQAAIPLGRLGAPRDIGMAVRFLASEEAAYITGQTLIVDGGQTLPEMATAVLPSGLT